ncbi:MAG: sugar phosphate isomerase/epimerase [Planctomycetes bacterium]|nr:sugar phosphate isomerase/epimerase [Planctomycetota bacterium]
MFFSGIADEASESIDEQIKAQKQIGWKHIELRNIGGVNVTDLCDETFDEIADKLTSAGLAVSDFGSQLCNWARPITTHPEIDRQELLRAIPRMQEMGCKYIRTMSYPNANWPEEKWRDEAIERLKVLARLAEEADITLVHENCDGWGGQGPEETLEMLEKVDSEHLKLVWDTGNPVPHQQDPWEYYRAVRDHIVYVHIKDGIMEDGDMRYTFCGEGDARVKEIVADLLERGYDGGFSIEPHLAAVIHEGKSAREEKSAFDLYVEYGQRLMNLVEEVR